MRVEIKGDEKQLIDLEWPYCMKCMEDCRRLNIISDSVLTSMTSMHVLQPLLVE